jgi:hypothetical protein
LTIFTKAISVMKKIQYTFLLLLLLASAALAMAQPGQGDPNAEEKIASLKVAFFTRQLSLTPDEAKVFWPVYDAYSAEQKKLREEMRDMIQDYKNNREGLSDADTEALADALVRVRVDEGKLIQSYHSQFKEVLPIRKVVRLYRAEEEFKGWILKEIQKQRMQNRSGARDWRK